MARHDQMLKSKFAEILDIEFVFSALAAKLRVRVRAFRCFPMTVTSSLYELQRAAARGIRTLVFGDLKDSILLASFWSDLWGDTGSTQ